MTLQELQTIICKSGGKKNALGYADALLTKINTLENTQRYASLFKQFNAATQTGKKGDEGDFRGRVLEINFAERFEKQSIALQYGARQQGRNGDIDFCWTRGAHEIFIEMKMLGQDNETKKQITKQIQTSGSYQIERTDGETTISTPQYFLDDSQSATPSNQINTAPFKGISTPFKASDDIGRIQRDIFQKSSTTKFNPTPEKNHINLVAIDVSELQLGMIDLWDCILAVGGNTYLKQVLKTNNKNDIFNILNRPDVVGAFEDANPKKPYSAEQEAWIQRFHSPCEDHHPRSYIHGILFLFREPAGTAVLSYDLSGLIIWNSYAHNSPDSDQSTSIENALYKIIPRYSFPKS